MGSLLSVPKQDHVSTTGTDSAKTPTDQSPLLTFLENAAEAEDSGAYLGIILSFFDLQDVSKLAEVSKIFADITETYYARKCAALKESPLLQTTGRLNKLDAWLTRQKQRACIAEPSSRWLMVKMSEFPLETFRVPELQHTHSCTKLNVLDASTFFVAFEHGYDESQNRVMGKGYALWKIAQGKAEITFSNDEPLQHLDNIPCAIWEDREKKRLMIYDHKDDEEDDDSDGFLKTRTLLKSDGNWECVSSNATSLSQEVSVRGFPRSILEKCRLFALTVDGNTVLKYSGWLPSKGLFVGDVRISGDEGPHQLGTPCICHPVVTGNDYSHACMEHYNKKWLLLNFKSTSESSHIIVMDLEKNTIVSSFEGKNGENDFRFIKADPLHPGTIYAMETHDGLHCYGTIVCFRLDESTGQLFKTGSFVIDGFEELPVPRNSYENDALQVDFMTDTLLVSDGRALFVCNAKNGAIKQTHTLLIPHGRRFWIPDMAILPSQNVYALTRGPDVAPSLYFLDD